MREGINILIVEDEFLTLDRLKRTLESFGYSSIFDAISVEEAITALQKTRIDLALLDINLFGKKDGTWLASFINKNYSIPFIFLTAYGSGETMNKAISCKPNAYLLKPFNVDELYAAIEIALNTHFSDPEKRNNKDYLIIKIQGVYLRLNSKDILFLEVKGNNLEIHTEGKSYLCRTTLKEVQKQLGNKDFIQSHRSFLVNKNKIQYINSKELTIKNYKLPISRSYRTNFMFFSA